MVVITVPHHRSTLTILEHVRQQAPHAHLVVRSRYKINTQSYVTAGAHMVVGDEEQVGESLATYIKGWLNSQEQKERD